MLMSFSCFHGNNPAPNPSDHCHEKDVELKCLFERNGGEWKCFYSDSLGERVDQTGYGLASPVKYNYIKFDNGRLLELNYDSIRIDTGKASYSNCGNQFVAKTNLSYGQNGDSLAFVVVSKSNTYVKMSTNIVGTDIRYFTIIK